MIIMLSDDRHMESKKSKEFTKFILIHLFNNIHTNYIIGNKKFLYPQNDWKQIFVMTLI